MNNPIADPMVEVSDTDAVSDLVQMEATALGAVTVTLNRPEKQNAFDDALILALAEAFETLHAQDGVRVVFLRGAGGVFSIGTDPAWVAATADHTQEDHRIDALQLARMLKALNDLPALTVALVEGAAFGPAAGLVCACDLVVATADAQFGFPEVRLGLAPSLAAPYAVRAIGARNAKALLATGRTFDANHAFQIGLATELAADAAAIDLAAIRIADEILAGGPQAVEEAKSIIDDVAVKAIDNHLAEETARHFARVRVGDEAREGVAALIEGRRPDWPQV